MTGCRADLGFAPCDFAFQKLDPFLELVNRQWVKVFAQQLLQRIGTAQRQIIIHIHGASVDWTFAAVNMPPLFE